MALLEEIRALRAEVDQLQMNIEILTDTLHMIFEAFAGMVTPFEGEERSISVEKLMELEKEAQEAGVAQNSLEHLIEATRPLGNDVLTESLEAALAEARAKGWAAQALLERAGAIELR